MGRAVCEYDPMASCFGDCDPCGPLPGDGHEDKGESVSDKGMVYVAGPYTHPDPVENTHQMILAGVQLRDAGYCPLIPTLSLLTHIVSPHPPDYWYEWDIDMLARCDVMLRLPGESWGADREAEYAEANGIPVYHGTAEEFLDDQPFLAGSIE